MSRSKFQSTLPLRGATHSPIRQPCAWGNFNPHSPCGERHELYVRSSTCPEISIHTPLAGSDPEAKELAEFVKFQSTLPLRGATGKSSKPLMDTNVFQSTLPLRGATVDLDRQGKALVFQSTLPLRGATGRETADGETHYISIHTPLAGSDARVHRRSVRLNNFNPHSPCGERPKPVGFEHVPYHFNPHSPCGERPPHNIISSPF